MFRRLHLQMTIFSTLITGVILAAMTLVCLFIAESGTRKNSYTTFSNNANSCITHLEGQSLLFPPMAFAGAEFLWHKNRNS